MFYHPFVSVNAFQEEPDPPGWKLTKKLEPPKPVKNLSQAKNMTNDYFDSRTPEERKNEPKSVTTFASAVEPENKDWGDDFFWKYEKFFGDIPEWDNLIKDISDLLAEARKEEQEKLKEILLKLSSIAGSNDMEAVKKELQNQLDVLKFKLK